MLASSSGTAAIVGWISFARTRQRPGPADDAAHEPDAVDQGHGVGIVRTLARLRGLVEVVEVDERRIAGIRAAQPDRAVAVARVALEDRPRERRVVLDLGVTELVSPEVERQPEDEQIRLIEVGVRALEDAEDCPVARVETGAFGAPLLEVTVDRLPLRDVEGGAVEQREVLRHLADETDLVAVLQVLADAWQVDPTRRPGGRSGVPSSPQSAHARHRHPRWTRGARRSPIPESISSCGVLNAPPQSTTSPCASTNTRFAVPRPGSGSPWRRFVRAVEARHAAGTRRRSRAASRQARRAPW